MSNKKVLQIKKELEIIRAKNNGFISPELVLEYAKEPTTFLNKEFIWDDTSAGEKYRLLQASNVIRSINVTIVDSKRDDKIIKVREYVSLSCDRGENGYRHIAEVIGDDVLKLQYITDIQGDLTSFRNKLKTISDVADKHAEKIFKILELEKKNLRFKKQA